MRILKVHENSMFYMEKPKIALLKQNRSTIFALLIYMDQIRNNPCTEHVFMEK